MTRVLVTGSKGFIGKNLILALQRIQDISVTGFDIGDKEERLKIAATKADIIYHLAGVNRPEKEKEFITGNVDFTRKILKYVNESERQPRIIVTSSTQAELDNPYGRSKRLAEQELCAFSKQYEVPVFIYRLTNIFGKWCKPFYNSVIATFCYQAAHDEPLTINDPTTKIDFIYIDDVIKNFLSFLDPSYFPDCNENFLHIEPAFKVSLGYIVDALNRFKEIRTSAVLPDFSNIFDKYLYSTFLSYLEPDQLSYTSNKHSDNRGYLFEFIKSRYSGQIFISRTFPGITRGNHYHDTKVEKFCVIEGKAKVAIRHIIENTEFDFEIDGNECKVIDIPPGFTHNITNIGPTDLITIFWANEIFDPEKPDTYFAEV